MPPLAILSSSIFFYLASQSRSSLAENRFWGYIAAGVLALCIVPYTMIFMGSTNGRLLAREGGHDLVRRWATLNLGRSVVLVGSAVVGGWSVVN